MRVPGTGEEDAKDAQDVKDTASVWPVPLLGAPGNKKEEEGLVRGAAQSPDSDQSPVVLGQVEQEDEQEVEQVRDSKPQGV